VNKIKRDNSFMISLKASTKYSHRQRCKWKSQAQAWRTSRRRGTWPFPRNPSTRRNRRLGFVGKVGEVPIAIRSQEKLRRFLNLEDQGRPQGSEFGISRFPWSRDSYGTKSRLAIS
jgi:hypothetical protein